MSNRKKTPKDDSAASDQKQAAADHEQHDNLVSDSDLGGSGAGASAPTDQPEAPSTDANASASQERVDFEDSPAEHVETAPTAADHEDVDVDEAGDQLASGDAEDTRDDSDEWEERVETTYEQTAAGHRVTRRVTRRKSSRKTTREQAEETTTELTSETLPGWSEAPPTAYQAPRSTAHPAPVG